METETIRITIFNYDTVVGKYSMENETKYGIMIPEIKIRDLKKIKRNNALNFLFILDQKLEKIPKDDPAENQLIGNIKYKNGFRN